MGHKVSPLAFRIGYIKTWRTTGYYDSSRYGQRVSLDLRVRIFVEKYLKGIPVGNIFINNADDQISIVIYTSKTSLVLGKSDENVAKLNELLVKKFGGKFVIEVREVKKPELSAALVADSIARQLEKKLPYRRVIKQALGKTLEKGGMGIKVIISGRLNSADIARTETYKEGTIPTQTIRADIDYAVDRAQVTGTLGVKVWIYKGDIFKN